MDIMIGLQTAKIDQIPNATCVEITEKGVVAELAGKQEVISGQHVVVAVGSTSVEHTWTEDYCKNRGIECQVIGDAVKARRALQAIQEGVDAALAI